MEGTTERRKDSMEGVISQLPEDIIHHIQSYLDTKEAARTSIFCKTWYSAWLTCPTLNFGKSFNSLIDISKPREKFKFIKKNLEGYQEQRLCIEQLILGLAICDSYSASLMDEWIGIAAQNGVRRLELNFILYFGRLRSGYTLPSTIFEAKTLRELIVRGKSVKLEKRIGDKVMFNRLQKLHLSNVYIDDATSQGIIGRCPLIDNLFVSCCEGLKRIKVTNLCNLKEFTVWSGEIKVVEIGAPNLQYFRCDLDHCSLKLYTTEKLKYLSLVGTLPSATFFDNFMDKFPQVEDMRLAACWYGLKRFNISSHSLKRITLNAKGDLREVKIDAPSMVKFELQNAGEQLREVKIDAPSMVSFELHNTKFFPDLSLTNAPSQWVSKISISTLACYRMNSYQFCKLKGFLAQLIQSKISLVLHSYPISGLDDVRKIPIYPVVEVEALHLNFYVAQISTHSDFLDALVLTCHPNAIIVSRCHKATGFLYKNLIERRNQDCLTRHETESWHQDLKEAKFDIYDRTKDEWHPSDLKNWLEASWHWQKARFRLKWEAHTHSGET